MANTKHYDPKKITILAVGIPIHLAGGYAPGEFLTIEREGPDYTDQAGTDGEVVRERSHDRRATAVIKVMAQSEINTQLATLQAAGEAAQNGSDVGPFEVRDLNGSLLVAAGESWIMGPPNLSMDATAGVNEWSIRLAKVTMFVGGA